VHFFHIDALSSSVGLKVDFDMALLVIASGLYRLMAKQMRGYNDAQARQIFRDLIDMSADVAITDRDVTVRFHRRAHLPIVLDSELFKKTRPSPGGTAYPCASSSRKGARRPVVRRITVRGNPRFSNGPSDVKSPGGAAYCQFSKCQRS
jgi:hypothetical protein